MGDFQPIISAERLMKNSPVVDLDAPPKIFAEKGDFSGVEICSLRS
jgi:hypothetical protein